MPITGSTEVTFNPNAPDVGSTTPGVIVPTRAILLANGNTLLGWTAYSNNGGASAMMQIFDPSGNPIGSPFADPNGFSSATSFLDAVPTSDGGFFAQINMSGEATQFVRYDSAGNLVGQSSDYGFQGQTFEMTILPGNGLAVFSVDIIETPNGNGTSSYSDRAMLRVFDAAGQLVRQTIIAANVQSSSGSINADITVLPNGNIVATWVEPILQEFDTPSLHAQVFDSAGGSLTTAFIVDPAASFSGFTTNHVEPLVKSFADGSFIILWNRTIDTVFQLFNADGSPQGAVISLGDGLGADINFAHDLVTLPDMTFVVGGTAGFQTGADQSGTAIVARQYNRDGAAVGDWITLNSSGVGDQSSLRLAATSDGGFNAIWLDSGELTDLSSTFDPNVVLDVWRQRDFSLTTAVNTAPVAQDSTASGTEDSAIVGQALATDANGDTLTYSIESGPAHGTLSFNANGSYVYTANANYHGADSFTFRTNDGAASSNVATVSLSVASVNDVPTDLDLLGATIAENAANGTVVGTATSVDVDRLSGPVDGAASYTLTENAGGRFAIDAATGVLTVADGSLLNFEAATSHSVNIRVTDGFGASYDEAFTVTVGDVNESPDSLTLLSGGTVAENSASGAIVAQFAATDPDAVATLTYSLVNDAGGRFAIDATTGQLAVADSALLDYEVATSHSVTVRVTDQGGLYRDLTTSIGITDVNEEEPINVIDGTDRSDFLVGTDGNDEINAGRGSDTVFARGGNDMVDGGLGDDFLDGGAGDDEILGGVGRDNLFGGSGSDFLDGGVGRDTLFGGSGNDVLFGGAGQDILTGGSGQDVFRFTNANDSLTGSGTRDWITDFNPNAGANHDIIDLSQIDANANAAGDQAFAFIGNAAFSNVAGELRYANGIVSGDINGDGVADFQIQVQSGFGPLPVLDNGDFIL